jgi:hypothetical protein
VPSPSIVLRHRGQTAHSGCLAVHARMLGLGERVGKRPAMRAEDVDTEVGGQRARARLVLALIAWVVVGSITIGSLLYTALGRVFA